MKNQEHSVLSILLSEYREKYKEAMKTRETTKEYKEYVDSRVRLKIYGEEIRNLKKKIQRAQRLSNED